MAHPICRTIEGLFRLYNCDPPPSPVTKPDTITIVVVIGPEQPRRDELQEGIDMANDLTLGLQKQRDVDITDIKDAAGKPVEFDGAVTWASLDDTISDVRVYDPATGLKVCVGSFDKLGATTVEGTGDRRKGPEVVPAVITLNVMVQEKAGDVESYTVTVGEEVGRLEINPL